MSVYGLISPKSSDLAHSYADQLNDSIPGGCSVSMAKVSGQAEVCARITDEPKVKGLRGVSASFVGRVFGMR